MRIKLAGVFVDDQDKALAFYTNVPGSITPRPGSITPRPGSITPRPGSITPRRRSIREPDISGAE
jgi:hypothetical protein